MDATLRAKLDEARELMNNNQDEINANRKHDDPVMREWARGRQRPANEERAQFRNSLTDEDRSQIEERIQQLVDDLPALSSTNARTLGSNEARPSVSTEVLDEYYFLRDIVGWWINPMLRKRVSSRLFPAALCQNFHVRMVAAQFVENLIGG